MEGKVDWRKSEKKAGGKKLMNKKQHKNGKKVEFKKKVSKTSQAKQSIDTITAQYSTIDTKKIKKFSDFPISPATLKGLEDAGYKKPTEIQRESIGLALRGLDILGAAKTGSGKTLAFIIPIIERLWSQQWSRFDGVGALIITPTRELAYQIFESLRVVGQTHDFSAGLVIGGKDLKFEWKRLQSCNIIVCTPGRLLQHLDENPAFSMANLQMLVLDEADRCLDLGFKDAMNSIISSLPSHRQTLLFSATQTRSVTDLARLSLEKPVYVSVHENSTNSTPDNLTQSYIVTELHNKVNILWSFLKNHKKKKILVFMQSCKQVKYMYELFCRLRPGLSVLALYGSLHQLRRMAIYDQYCGKESAVLFATDIAARGLDFPAVDWVIQLDCPEDGVTYVHRAGRTARYNTAGEALLILVPHEEQGMLKQLNIHKIPITKIEVNPNKLQQIEKKAASHLASDKNLKESAQRAFQSYLKSVFLMKNKEIFQVESLDTAKFAESLGLAVQPRVRFLDRQKKIREAQKQGKKSNTVKNIREEEEEEENEDSEEENNSENDNSSSRRESGKILLELSDDEEEEEGGEVLTLKRKHHAIEEEGEKEDQLNLNVKRSKGTVSKVQQAKKVLKKNIVPNSKITFNEETGDVETDNTKMKVSDEGKKYESEPLDRDGGGIDLEKAKQIMRAEDKFDKENERKRNKEKRKEKKMKEKEARRKQKEAEREDKDEEGSESDGESVDLSWLPDPDKIYGKAGADNSDEESDSDTQTTEVKRGESSITVIKKRIPKQSQEEDQVMDTGLSLEEDEDLVMQLLGR